MPRMRRCTIGASQTVKGASAGVRLHVEGTNGGEVGFNGLWLQAAGPEVGDPFHDASLSGGDAGSIAVDECWACSDEIDE